MVNWKIKLIATLNANCSYGHILSEKCSFKT